MKNSANDEVVAEEVSTYTVFCDHRFTLVQEGGSVQRNADHAGVVMREA